MPLKFPKRKVSDAENKLRVLFCVHALGMVTAEQLWPFVAGLDLMDYVPFCLYVDELKKDGALTEGVHALKGMLYLTEEGERTLAMFEQRMVQADCERIRKAAPAYAARLNERLKARAAYERPQNGLYSVACTVREGDMPTLFLRVSTADEKLARRVAQGFRMSASRLLTLLYTLPFEPSARPLPVLQTEKNTLEEAQAGKPSLCAYGKHEHAAAVWLSDGRAHYTVSLLLPSREVAQGWAEAAMKQSGKLAAKLTTTIEAAEAGA